MRLSKFRGVAVALALSSASGLASAEEALLRIRCDDFSEGAQVFINGTLKGECPLNVQVVAGTVHLRARKSVDADHERVFEQDILVGGGMLKSIDLVLPAPQLTERARQARQLTAQRQAAEALARTLRETREKAAAGDPRAMEELVRRYSAGDGVEKSPAQAQVWRMKAVASEQQRADAGDIDAMDSLAARYAGGNGVKADASVAGVWRDKAAAARQAQAAQAQAEAAQQERERQLKNISFVEFTTGTINPDSQQWQQIPSERRPLAYTSSSTLMLPAAILFDVISTPSKITKMRDLQREAALRPASWARPDSMVAKAGALSRGE